MESLFYEHHSQPLLPRRQFLSRLVKHGLFALAMMVVSLGIGILGYHYLEGMQWLDALLNASMILGGMGPVGNAAHRLGKVFASFYALFSGRDIPGDRRDYHCADRSPLTAPATPGRR